MLKKIIIIVVIVLLGIALAIKLNNNKATMEAATKKSDIKMEYPVNIVSVVKQKLQESLSIVGNVIPNNDVAVLSETFGRVVTVNTKVGASIAKGAIIAKVDDEIKEANLKLAEANFDKTKKDLDRAEALFTQKSMTESQVDAIRLAFKSAESNLVVAKRQLNDTKITSPISGVVVARNVDVGSTVDNKSIVANIIDISILKVKLNVPEGSVFKLKNGSTVDITTEALPGVVFKGKVDYISAKGDETHTFPIEIIVLNKGKNQLKAGMFARVTFTSISEHEGLILPRQALLGSSKDAKVFVIDNNGIAKIKTVVLGNELNNQVEVVSGLNEGERVVVNGQNNLKDGLQVTILNK